MFACRIWEQIYAYKFGYINLHVKFVDKVLCIELWVKSVHITFEKSVLTKFWNTNVHIKFVGKSVLTESVEEEVRTVVRQ